VKTTHFLSTLEHEHIKRAIERAEQHTSADIVVYITHKEAPDALAAAKEVFTTRKLTQAEADTSLLIFLSPPSHTFAVIGGKALHEAMGQAWWEEIASILRTHFRTKYYSEGIITAVRFASKGLRKPFPAEFENDRAGQDDLIED
jgi:uncharacterized membrane protein